MKRFYLSIFMPAAFKNNNNNKAPGINSLTYLLIYLLFNNHTIYSQTLQLSKR